MRARTELSAETRRILALAWPVVLTSLNWTILHVTDVIVVGLTGTGEVAYLGASLLPHPASHIIRCRWEAGWGSGLVPLHESAALAA